MGLSWGFVQITRNGEEARWRHGATVASSTLAGDDSNTGDSEINRQPSDLRVTRRRRVPAAGARSRGCRCARTRASCSRRPRSACLPRSHESASRVSARMRNSRSGSFASRTHRRRAPSRAHGRPPSSCSPRHCSSCRRRASSTRRATWRGCRTRGPCTWSSLLTNR